MEMDPPPKMLASLTITILIMMIMATSVALASLDAAVLEGQARALLDWKASLDNQSQRALHSWGNTSTPCNWRGITCGTGVHWHRLVIKGISLRGMRLRGALESLNFSALRTLTRLDLSHNLLAGSIPPSIEILGELHALPSARQPDKRLNPTRSRKSHKIAFLNASRK
ncbi:receptor kinase-like protein Xa21 [Triticum aestivum]|uniref:receptor kinase-like protein Xa21 n=1 Tax=Triticum aestivum TaxID=4565 RepID=UPI001D0322F7|nr:receptor kinase-like protein Xa21 [Triticum aestivum]